MFFAERILLVAGAAFVANAGLGSCFCTSDMKGDLDGRAVTLGEVTLQPPTPSWNIVIPAVENCVKVGVMMTCCDDEAAPQVVLTNLGSAIVVRTGPVRVPATVKTTVFCHLGSPAAPRAQPQPQRWTQA